jgi:hypothetical protein
MLGGAILISLNTPILTERNLIGLAPAYALLTVWFIQHVDSPKLTTVAYGLLCLLLVQSVALTYSPYLFIQQNFRSIAEHSIATNSKVCYVVPFGNKDDKLPEHIYSFYITKIFHRPDLVPELMRPADVPQDPAAAGCNLWAAAALPKGGTSLLRTFPQFARCADVSLAKPGVPIASELVACHS